MHCGQSLASAMPDATVLDATADDFVMPPAFVPVAAQSLFSLLRHPQKKGEREDCSVMTESWSCFVFIITV